MKFFKGLGTGLGEFGNMFDQMLVDVTAGFDELTKKFISLAGAAQIPGAGGIDPETGELQSGTLKGTVQRLTSGGQQSSLNTSVKESTTAQSKNTEATNLLRESVTTLVELVKNSTPGGGSAASAGTGEGETQVTLIVGGKEMNAYLKGALPTLMNQLSNG